MNNPSTLILSFMRTVALVCAAFALLHPFNRASAAGRKPTIYAFNVAAESTLIVGTTTSLNWSVGDATSIRLEPGRLDVTHQTSVEITPTTTTTYVLTATNSAGSVSRSRTITVIVPPAIQAFSATPDSLNTGATARLKWSAPGATWFYVEADVGNDPGQFFTTSAVVKPAATTTYTLTAHNAAGTDVKTLVVPVAAPLPKPTISSFTAAPSSVVVGGATTLSWAVNGATSLAISPDVGAVAGTRVTVSPTTTTTYTLTAKNSGGTVTKKTTVTVTPPAPVIAAFTASPATITQGASTALNWSIDGAATVSISPAIGVVLGSSLTVQPSATTDYVLTATNAGGTVSQTVTVIVNAPIPAPVIRSFAVSPASIPRGSVATLAWVVSGAGALSITADTGASPGVVTGTSLSVSPTANTTYTLTATNVTGSVAQTASVMVTNPAPPPVIASFAASPTTIALGASSTLSWSVTGATSLSVSSNVGASPGAVTGTSVVVSPVAATTYTLTAQNGSGTVAQSVDVTVSDPAPVVGSFVTIPNTINAGESTRLFWDVQGAATIAIAADRGPSPGVVPGPSASLELTPATTTLYTLTATSPGGVVTHSVAQVSVLAAPPLPVPVINSFTADPDTLALGSPTTLNWSITAADSIAIAADQGASPGVVTGSSVSVSPTVDTLYTITATNTFGSVTQSIDVTVHGPSAPIVGSFFASPAFVPAGGSATLTWSVSGAEAISIAADHGAGPGDVTGTSVVVNPTDTTTYTLTATNAMGSTTAIAPVTIYAPGSGGVTHPRIWVTPATAASLNTRAAANDPAWLRLRNECDAYVAMPIQFPDEEQVGGTINGGYQYNDYLPPSETLALGYVATKTADPVRAARYAAKERELLLKLSDPVHHGRPTTDSGYSIRSYVPALALGYDWIFATLSDSDRAQIYTEINRWIESYEATGFGRDYPQGNYFAGYYCAKPLGALATEGENPQGPAMWNDWLNRVHYGMVQPYHAAWLSGGGAPDGWNYGQFETINMLRPIAAAFTAKGLDLIHAARPFAYPDGHAKWITQFSWPDLKTASDRGFVYNSDNPTWTDAGWATQFAGLLRLANGSNAPLMQRYALELRALSGTGEVEAWAEFLLHDPAAPAADYRTDLSYATPGDGQVAMRSSWASNAVWAAFQAGPYTGYPSSSEEFFDEGSLAIQRGGVQFLVNTWGAMMRNTPGTSDGDPVFNDVYNELFQEQTDGVNAGRRIFNTYYAVRPGGYWGQAGNTPFDHSATTLSRFEEGGSYVLMRGTHLEEQYFSDHPIAGWTRTVAYVRPQLFVVYDRTSLKTGADNWMAWHMAPLPRERTDAVAGTHAFDVTDTRAAFGGDLFRGRVTTILPAGHVVNNVDVFGRGKVYRLEVRAPAPVLANAWLTVFDASSTAAAAKNAAPLIATVGGTPAAEGTLLSGGNGGNLAVLFSKSGAPIVGPLGFQVPAADTYCLLPDLTPAAGYTATASVVNGGIALNVAPGGPLLASADGTLAFTVSATGAVTAP
jgi:hypothetical protein